MLLSNSTRTTLAQKQEKRRPTRKHGTSGPQVKNLFPTPTGRQRSSHWHPALQNSNLVHRCKKHSKLVDILFHSFYLPDLIDTHTAHCHQHHFHRWPQSNSIHELDRNQNKMHKWKHNLDRVTRRVVSLCALCAQLSAMKWNIWI